MPFSRLGNGHPRGKGDRMGINPGETLFTSPCALAEPLS